MWQEEALLILANIRRAVKPVSILFLFLFQRVSNTFAFCHLYSMSRLPRDLRSRVPYPLVGIGTPPTPLPQASVPPPRTNGGGAHSPAAKGFGKSQFRRLEISLALCLLCALEYVHICMVKVVLSNCIAKCQEKHSSFLL